MSISTCDYPADSVSLWWQNTPRLISIKEMIKQYGSLFYKLSKTIELFQKVLDNPTDDFLEQLKKIKHELNFKAVLPERSFLKALDELELRLSKKSLERFASQLPSINTINELREFVKELDGRLKDELDSVWFMHLPTKQADLYINVFPFDLVVIDRLPSTQFDIEEAAKCLAVRRATACVFHLMRVMEHAVQEFGTKLGIKLVVEKQWQVILDQINKAIRSMPDKTPSDKERKTLYSESAAYLFNVKIAWRNPVMHPKDSYNEEQAEEIFSNVKTFVSHLVQKVLI